MAKRQVENTIFQENWFMDLPIQYKILMLYFFITSDHAGLGNLNFKIINILVGYEYDKKDALNVLSEHLKEYKEGKYQLIKYMDFHYTDDNRSKVYLSALKKLKNEGLIKSQSQIEDDEKIAIDKGLVSKNMLKKIDEDY